MKRTVFFMAGIFFLISCSEEDNPAKEAAKYKITGYVVDNLNTRQSAAVSRTNKSGEEETTTAGSNGEFNFSMEQGVYTIEATKPGFNGESREINVSKDENIGALRLTIKPAEVTTKQDTLDFGESYSSLSLTFQVLSFIDDEWEIKHNCPWIQKIDSGRGKLIYNEKEKKPRSATVSVQIDREKLVAGKNADKIQITTTSNGGLDITVLAYNKSTPPSIITEKVTQITPTSATFNATLTEAGNPGFIESGFVYAKTSPPSLTNTIRKITASVNSNGIFSANEKNLDFYTLYYVQAYAFSAVDTVYGKEVNFISGAELATLSTNAATGISANSAVLGGNIMTSGTPPYTERGVCYGTSPMPTIDNSSKVIIAGSGTGNFSQQVQGLSPGTKYYARAYAQSGNSGTAYGEEISLTTHAPVSVSTLSVSSSNITTTTAQVYGNILNAGVPTYTEKGICYGTSNNPTVESAFRLPVSGTGTGSYYASINNLNTYTSYYACAYAINESGIVYGNTVNFTTKSEKATVSTQAPTTLSGSSVRLNGTIVTSGNPVYTERGFVCGMSASPTVSDTKAPVSGQGSGSFSAIFNSENNYIFSYHVRAYAINADKSVSYGEDQMFFFEVSF